MIWISSHRTGKRVVRETSGSTPLPSLGKFRASNPTNIMNLHIRMFAFVPVPIFDF